MKTFLSLLLILLGLHACVEKKNHNPLEALRILSAEEQEGRTISLNASIPSYTESGEQISKKEWGKFMDEGKYERILYTDSTSAVKAIVFKKVQGKSVSKQPKKRLDKSEELVGKQALNFKAKGIEGRVFELEKLKGKLVVLNFWFTECKPCILEMKDLNALKDKYTDSVVFLGITFDEPKKVNAFLKTTAFDYTILPEASAVCKDWGVNAYPTNMVIDKKGIVQYVQVGLDRNIKVQLDSVIQKFL